MKRITQLFVLVICVGFIFPVFAADRKGKMRLGVYAPGLFFGNKNIGAMMSFGAEGEYFFFENLSASLRLEEATDFNSGASPHSVLNFVARARYVFDVGDTGRWALYLQGGGGGALIGSSHGAGDVAIPGCGFWYQFKNKWLIGADSSLHILVSGNTAFAFDVTPALKYQF